MTLDELLPAIARVGDALNRHHCMWPVGRCDIRAILDAARRYAEMQQRFAESDARYGLGVVDRVEEER